MLLTKGGGDNEGAGAAQPRARWDGAVNQAPHPLGARHCGILQDALYSAQKVVVPFGPVAEVDVNSAFQVALEFGILVRHGILQDDFGGVVLRHGNQDALLDGHRQDGIAAIVDVLSDEVNPPGNADYNRGAASEPLFKRLQEAGDPSFVRMCGNGGIFHGIHYEGTEKILNAVPFSSKYDHLLLL